MDLFEVEQINKFKLIINLNLNLIINLNKLLKIECGWCKRKISSLFLYPSEKG